MIGIYKFTNKINGLSYIGQSIHIEHRYQEHMHDRFVSNKNDTDWYKALNEFGPENFEFTILEECSADKLDEREIYWIDYYDTYFNGYNSTPGGQAKYYDPQPIFDAWNEGLTITEISEKLGIGTTTIYNNLQGYPTYSAQESNRRGGLKARQTAIQNSNVIHNFNYIYQYTLQGDFIKKWDSCKEVHRELGYDACLIGKCVAGKRKSAYDYQWKDFYKEKIEPYLGTVGKTQEIIQKDLQDNEIQRFPSVAAAARAVHGDGSLISRVCKDPKKTAYGFKWSKA